MREILVNWSVNGIQSQTVLYFESTPLVNAQRLAIFNFLDGIENQLAGACTWSVATDGRELSEATGTLTGFWADTVPYTGQGQAVGASVADASQGLVRWRTSVIVRGRLLQGRMFLPGLANSQEVGGNLAPGAVTAINGEAADLVAAPVLLSVWSRPVNGAGGILAEVESASTWSEFAVLRRRRR